MLRVDYGDQQGFYSEWTENLSAGGLFVRTERTFQMGEEVTLHLSFPGLMQPLEVTGKVAWVRARSAIQAAGVGVEVTSDRGRRKLTELALAASKPAALTRPQPYRVVVVEDNTRVTRSYERVLQHLALRTGGRIQVSFAENGLTAIEHINKQGADLVVTDIYMPVMDGFQMIEQLRHRHATRDIPVIVITGGRSGERERAEALGVQAFLHKPIQFGQFLETIVCLVAVA
ncbi:MAG: TIGR02266 family protein [Deltaproteobacteria bacterium]|nr:TIGR02266 family protein [Deltaproteobacteria bacterium]